MRKLIPVLCLALMALFGCTRLPTEPNVAVVIAPPIGYAPYEATIRCVAPPGTFTFRLPDRTVGPQAEGRLEVIVDRPHWEAVVTWTDGNNTVVRRVSAGISNAPPRITGVLINGKKDLWILMPMQRTLLQAVVLHSGPYRVVEYSVTGSRSAYPYSVFYPPYEAGVCQAYWNGWIIDDACIVYPLYASIEGHALPYSPTGLDAGYPTSYLATNRLDGTWPQDSQGRAIIPEQEGAITVTVEDAFGRRVSRTFSVPIHPSGYREQEEPIDSGPTNVLMGPEGPAALQVDAGIRSR